MINEYHAFLFLTISITINFVMLHYKALLSFEIAAALLIKTKLQQVYLFY
ncbi:hypothetical protein BC749_10783 [Flavobacterium araucananum]|nr:hypothetical protein BC749_10783 [Flavobacterium araucananum]